MFLTGGTGFIGKSLLDFLRVMYTDHDQRFEVVVLSRNPNGFLASNPQYSKCAWLSFEEGDLMFSTLKTSEFTDVIHAAADSHFIGNRIDWMRQIVDGTQRILDFSERCGVHRFLNISSGAVYGVSSCDSLRIREDSDSAPLTGHLSSVYGQSKRLAEQLMTIYVKDRGMAGVNARCFAFSGSHLPMHGAYALGNFVRDAIFSDAVRIKGNGAAVRSYLDAKDMAYALLLLLQKAEIGQTYNVGSSCPISVLDLAHLVVRIIAPHKPVIVEGARTDSAASGAIYVPCIEKLESLGFSQTVALEDSVRFMAQAYANAEK